MFIRLEKPNKTNLFGLYLFGLDLIFFNPNQFCSFAVLVLDYWVFLASAGSAASTASTSLRARVLLSINF